MKFERKKRHNPYLEKQATRCKCKSQKQLEGDLIFKFPLFPYSILLLIPVGSVNFRQQSCIIEL